MKAQTTTPTVPASDVVAECVRYSRAGILRRRLRVGGLGAAWKVLLVLNDCAKRGVDLLVAIVGLLTFAPVFVLIAIVQGISGKPVLLRTPRSGRWGVPFQLLELNVNGNLGGLLRRLRLHRLPQLLNVVRGDMSLVGPRPGQPEQLSLRQRAVRKRSSVRPGIVSLWWLREQANIDFGSEFDVDAEYIDGQSVRGDLGIALRALPAILYGSGSAAAPDRVEVLGIPILNITMEEALDYILRAAGGSRSHQLCFVNTDCVNKAQGNQAYAELLRVCDAVLADGIGIRIAGKILRQEIRQNVNGTDLFPLLCDRLQGSDIGLFLLGARPGVVEAVNEWIDSHYPGAKVKGTQHGFFSPAEQPALLRQIRDSGAGILLVAFGSPQQDMWIAEHLAETGVGIAMGVGGLFDFYSGRIPRAPQWMRELSLEWMFRLCQEPSRMWKRYLLGNFVFLSRVVWSKMRRRRILEPPSEV